MTLFCIFLIFVHYLSPYQPTGHKGLAQLTLLLILEASLTLQCSQRKTRRSITVFLKALSSLAHTHCCSVTVVFAGFSSASCPLPVLYWWSSPALSPRASSLRSFSNLYLWPQRRPLSPDYRPIYPACSTLLLGCLMGTLNLTYPKLKTS